MKKGDVFVFLFAIGIMFLWGSVSHSGSVAAIYVDGKLYDKVSLDANREIVIESEFGKNTVIIKDGEVSVTDADCPGKECEKGRISETARSIICLPNRLSIIIEDKKTNDETDVIV